MNHLKRIDMKTILEKITMTFFITILTTAGFIACSSDDDEYKEER